jgi:nitroreductase
MSDMTALERLLADRWSCRGYLPDEVPRETIERLLTVAGRTPSWCNTQPWEVTVLSGEATSSLVKAMAEDAEHWTPDIPFPPGYEGVYADRRRESGWQLYEAVGVAKGDRDASAAQMLRNFEFFGAPHAAIVTTTASLGPYGAVDCGLFIDSFLLGAQALGLGACAQAAIAMRAGVVREHLGLADDRQVVAGIAFGVPDPEHPTNTYRTNRVPLDEFVTFRD